MAQGRRIKVKGVRKETIDPEMYGLILWLQAKRLLAQRRENEAKARAKQRQRDVETGR
jgi:hypothetical protein